MSVGAGGLLHGFSLGAGFELTRRVVVPAILAAVPLLLWWWLGPEKPVCDPVRREVAETAVSRVAGSIHDIRGDIRRAAVLHLTNDPTDFVTRALRRQLMDSGTLDVESTPWNERFCYLLNLRIPGVFSVDKALDYGRGRGLDAVIIGSVDRFETVQGKGVLNGLVKLIRVKTGETVDIPLSDRKITGVASLKATGTISLPLRLLLMAAGVFALPVLAFPLLRLAMGRDSNLVTAAALVFLLAVDGLIISSAIGLSDTFFGTAAFLIALAASLGYDLFMLSYAQLCCPKAPKRRSKA